MDDKKLLKSRAEKLAVKNQVAKQAELTVYEVLEFMLSGERYAIASSYVGEVLTIQELTPVPGTSDYFTGLMNVRGRIIPVVSLKRFFRLKETGIVATTKAIILQNESYEVAFLADVILSTSQVAESVIKPVPIRGHGIVSEYLLGITRDALIVIDGNSLINLIEQSLTNKKH